MKEKINKMMTELDGIERGIREIWPDDKSAPAKNDIEYWLYNSLLCAMVHISDLKYDLESALEEV